VKVAGPRDSPESEGGSRFGSTHNFAPRSIYNHRVVSQNQLINCNIFVILVVAKVTDMEIIHLSLSLKTP